MVRTSALVCNSISLHLIILLSFAVKSTLGVGSTFSFTYPTIVCAKLEPTAEGSLGGATAGEEAAAGEGGDSAYASSSDLTAHMDHGDESGSLMGSGTNKARVDAPIDISKYEPLYILVAEDNITNQVLSLNYYTYTHTQYCITESNQSHVSQVRCTTKNGF